MYSKYRTKEGDLGPRGFDGYPGKQGDDGECNQIKCRRDLLGLMIVKKIEDKMNKKLTESEVNTIIGKVPDGNALKKMTYNDVDKFNDEITYRIEVNDDPLEEINKEDNTNINIPEIINEIIKKNENDN